MVAQYTVVMAQCTVVVAQYTDYRSGGSVHSCGGSVATHTRYEEVHGSVRKYGVFFNREVVKHLLLKTVIGLLIRESE